MPVFAPPSILIIGGNSLVGTYLAHRLHAQGHVATLVSRRPMETPPGFTFIQTDAPQDPDWRAPEGAHVLSLLPLWILEKFLPKLKDARKIVAVGSTSLFSKTDSDDIQEREIAQKLQQGEAALRDWGSAHRVPWIVLRPTLIYDAATDKNIARMAGFIRRWGFLPVAAPATGLRQPIHADDVAQAVLAALHAPVSCDNRAFNISGAEILTYRAMAERVFALAGRKPRFLMLLPAFLRAAFRTAEALGLLKEKSFGASIFLRMNQDLVFDTKQGLDLLDLHPRPFNLTKAPR